MAPRSAADPSPPQIGQAGARFRAGDLTGAERLCRVILAADPGHFDALHLLGVLCQRRGAPAEALVWLQRADAVMPAQAQVRENIGLAALAAERPEIAVAAFEIHLDLAGPTPGGQNNLGNALLLAGQAEAATARFQAALALAPNFSPARYNLGRALERAGRLREAEAALRTVLPAAPPDRLPLVINLLGRVLCGQGRYPEAEHLASDLLERQPDQHRTRWNRSLVRLLLGDFEAGWRDYESRWLVPEHTPAPEGHTVLDPAKVAGRRVLVVAEQGLGDTIQFARYAPMLADHGAEVWLSVPPELVWLCRTLRGVRGVVATGDPAPPPDLTTAMLSLPLAFGTDIPAEVPYLHVPPHAAAAWGHRIAAMECLRVGLAWTGSRASAPRSALPLTLLAPLLAQPGVTFHCLQKQITAQDQAWLESYPGVRTHDAEWHDFADTAAVMARLDLVITIDTSVAHLAGAMGRPTWIMLPFDPDWRWQTGRRDSPWYPSVRLFRQPAPGDWASVVAQVTAALEKWAGT